MFSKFRAIYYSIIDFFILSIDWLAAYIDAVPVHFYGIDQARVTPAGGTPLDPGLLNSLRHEAGVPRMGAARNC